MPPGLQNWSLRATKNNNPERVDGTCQWVLSHDQYLRWTTKAQDDLLWISADPGCGKSVLARSLIDKELQNTADHTVCYFFFRDNNEEQDNLATALCTLLHQLFSQQPQLIRYALPAWEKTGQKVVKDVPELWEMLLTAARGSEAHNVTCIFDALDECRPSDRRLLIEMLTSFYTRISSSQPNARNNRLKFLVTSRPYDDIQAEFHKTLGHLPTIRLRGEEENDQIHQEIDLVVRIRVDKVAQDLRLDLETKKQLTEKLLRMEHRTYLWLYLAIEDICQTYRRSLRPREALVSSLPSTVEDAYEKILARVSEEQQGDVKKILQIVIGARRPLTVQEMALALGMATSTQPKSIKQAELDSAWLERNICDWCGLFVFINHSKIYLIHQTAKDFLVSRSSASLTGWKHCLSSREIEKSMARICTDFICLADFERGAALLMQKVDEHPIFWRIASIADENDHVERFFFYSAEYWPHHFRNADIPTDDAFVADASRLCKTANDLCRLWSRIFWESMMFYASIPPIKSIHLMGIHLMALAGHGNMLERALLLNDDFENDIKIDIGGKTGELALILLCHIDYDEVVQDLPERGADIDAQGEKDSNAPYPAPEHGYEKVVRILLDQGVDVNAQGSIYGNALCAASAHGHEKIVRILLDRDADVNAQRRFYGNALGAASVQGHENVVQILLDGGADINIKDACCRTALWFASAHGHKKTAQTLLDRGADINTRAEDGRNALQVASENGHEEVLQMLLDRGAIANSQVGHMSSISSLVQLGTWY